MPFKVGLTNLQNVAAGNTATLLIPVGRNAPTFDRIMLALSGGALPAHVERIVGKANGRIFMDEVGGTELAKREAYRGIDQLKLDDLAAAAAFAELVASI